MGLLVLLFFLTLALSRNAASSFFYPVVLLGLWGLILAPSRIKLKKWEKVGLFIIVAWFAVAVLSHVYNGFPGNGYMMLQKRYSKLLYAIPVFLYFRQFPLNPRYLWLIGVLLSIELGLIAVAEQWNDGLFMYPGRASGNVHPIPFALIASCGAILVMTLTDYRSNWSRIIALIASLFAAYAIIQSGSRGIWVAVPVLGYLLLWLKYRQAFVKPALVFTLVVIVASYSNPSVKNRVNTAVFEIENYLASTDVSDPARYSSMGGRLEMWRAAGTMFSSSPWLGVGPDGFRVQSQQLVDSGEWSGKLMIHMFPHNIYLTALATMGLFGLLIMLAFFAGCLTIYGRVICEDSRQGKQVASAGLLITVLFMVGGLSDDNIAQKLSLTVFVFTQALLLGHMSYFMRCDGEN